MKRLFIFTLFFSFLMGGISQSFARPSGGQAEAPKGKYKYAFLDCSMAKEAAKRAEMFVAKQMLAPTLIAMAANNGPRALYYLCSNNLCNEGRNNALNARANQLCENGSDAQCAQADNEYGDYIKNCNWLADL